MAIHSVSYDLKAPGRNYEALYDLLKSYAWCRITASHWLLDSSDTPQTLFEKIAKVIDANDAVAVFPVQREAGWWTQGLDESQLDWLKQKLSR